MYVIITEVLRIRQLITFYTLDGMIMKLYLMLALTTALSIGLGLVSGQHLKNQDVQAASVEKDSEISESSEPVIFNLGQMMVPIYRANNVSYVMADIRLSLMNEEQVVSIEDNYDFLRSEALETMVNSASLGHFNDATINQDRLANTMLETFSEALDEESVKEVLFTHLIRQDDSR